jgi:hypothetical protein
MSQKLTDVLKTVTASLISVNTLIMEAVCTSETDELTRLYSIISQKAVIFRLAATTT